MPLPRGLVGPAARDRADPQALILDIGHLPWAPILEAVVSTEMANFGMRPPVQQVLRWHITPATLTILNRPGAWLLDYAYTLVCVLFMDLQPSTKFAG